MDAPLATRSDALRDGSVDTFSAPPTLPDDHSTSTLEGTSTLTDASLASTRPEPTTSMLGGLLGSTLESSPAPEAPVIPEIPHNFKLLPFFPEGPKRRVPLAYRIAPWEEDGDTIVLAAGLAAKCFRQDIVDSVRYGIHVDERPIGIQDRNSGCSISSANCTSQALSMLLGWIKLSPAQKRAEAARDLEQFLVLYSNIRPFLPRGLRGVTLHVLSPYYRDRYTMYSQWDGRSPLTPPINPVLASNAIYGLPDFNGRDDFDHFSLLAISLLDASLYVRQRELLGPDPPASYPSSRYYPGIDYLPSATAYKELGCRHKHLCAALAHVVDGFQEGRPLVTKRRCCSFKTSYKNIVEALRAQREDGLAEDGRLGICIIRDLVNADANAPMTGACSNCVLQLHQELMGCYRLWWTDISHVMGGEWETIGETLAGLVSSADE
ncbi:hypothetical protein BV25DRAFT_1916706 [Artomyces pyxidatus]|uniref:Uncharacterized protein n=1 Tax=Artomyces pyxidatus TaxID=48021 RepID=A0ACB8SYU8_9AGAM|nr:hypothetical protein BV25DRAFT_1916706 [Artomyces pyxidatus]